MFWRNIKDVFGLVSKLPQGKFLRGAISLTASQAGTAPQINQINKNLWRVYRVTLSTRMEACLVQGVWAYPCCFRSISHVRLVGKRLNNLGEF